ncbi:hypothetical protein BKI52_18790 [marine bacterium AO1-C]|nr:hypothetical protein BKI52_18790 [marine bacterium AO1-C]
MKNLQHLLAYPLLCFGLGLSFPIKAQNAFYEALYLAHHQQSIQQLEKLKNLIDFTPQELKQIHLVNNFLKKPFNIYPQTPNLAILRQAIHKLATAPRKERPQTEDGALPGVGKLIPVSLKKFSSFSGVKNADFYKGISKYIAAEFKKGLTLSFFDAFEKAIGGTGELQILFPTTYEALKTRDPFRFPALGTRWKEIFHQDLHNIVKNFIRYIDNPNPEAGAKATFLTLTFANQLKQNPQFQYLKLGDDIASKLLNRFHPVDLMNYLDLKYFQNPTQQYRSVGPLLHKLNLLQTNLRDTTGNIWINFEQFNRLNDSQIGLFLGLLYQQSPQVFGDLKTKVAQNNAVHPTKAKKYLLQHILPVYEGLIKIQEFEKSKGKHLFDQEYGAHMQNFADLLQVADQKLMVQSVLTPPPPEGNHMTQTSNFSKDHVLQKTLNVYKSIHQKEYNNLIPNMSKILLQMLNQSEKNTAFVRLLTKLDKYGNFMIGVVNAQNTVQLRDLLGKVVASTGSYLRKRTSLRTFSLSVHAGYYASGELLESTQTWGINTGFTIPIGLEYTFGFTSKYKPSKASKNYFTRANRQRFYKGSSLGIFLQIIDVGAMMNYRLFDNQTQTLPEEITFQQILAPGASINYGLKNTPLTIGVGYQYMPQLRRVDTTTPNRGALNNAHRFFLRISWDLPVLPIWASKK